MRASRLVALLLSAACALGISRVADATSVRLRFAGVTSGVTGDTTSTVTAPGGPTASRSTLTLDLRIVVDSAGLSSAFLSFQFDQDLRNELNVVSFEELSWTGAKMTKVVPNLTQLTAGIVSSQESARSQIGKLYTFEATTLGLGPVSTTITFARVVFVTNPTKLATDGGDIFAWVFNTGNDSVFNNAGGDITTGVFPTGAVFATVNSTGPNPPLGSLYSDFDGNDRSDILVFDNGSGSTTAGLTWEFLMNVTTNGTTPLSTSTAGPGLPPGWQVVGIGDVSDDGLADIIVFNSTTRETFVFKMMGGTVLGSALGPVVPDPWVIAGVGDFNGDRLTDLLLLQPSPADPGTYGLTWQFGLDFSQTTLTVLGAVGPNVGPGETIVGIGDFDGNGSDDFVTVDGTDLRSGATRVYQFDMGTYDAAISGAGPVIEPGWQIQTVGDFNGDREADMLIVQTATGPGTGRGWTFLMDGLTSLAGSGLFNRAQFLPADWEVGTVGDYNGDGKTDVVVRNTSTQVLYAYLMNGISAMSSSGLVTTLPQPGGSGTPDWIIPVSAPVNL